MPSSLSSYVFVKAHHVSVLNAMSELKIGSTLRLSNGENATVKNRLGDGGHGIVYQVTVNGHKMALKWYKMHPVQRSGRTSRRIYIGTRLRETSSGRLL